jgi:NTP pyrophosphatase (non-canonical NTP hydrolase)
MDANNYQTKAFETALPECRDISYMTIGLCNEAGEVAGKIKKYLRGDCKLTDIEIDIAKELGDTLWYLSGIAELCGIPLSYVMELNLRKINDRVKRKVQRGDGDNR